MSNLIPFDGSAKLPAHLAGGLGDDGNIAPRNSINMLTGRGKEFRVVIDGEEKLMTKLDKDTGMRVSVQVINLVVLDQNKGRSRAFYGDYEKGANKPPICASMDGVKPDAWIKEPVCTTCAACPNAVKGSKMTDNGKATTLCQPNKRVAVVPSGKLIETHPPLLMKLAQTSVWDKDNKANEADGWYAWDQYVDMLRSRGAKHTAQVETMVRFDSTEYPKLLFKASRWLDEGEWAAVTRVHADKAEEIKKILFGAPGANDGVAGEPGVSHEGVEAADPGAAQEAAAAAAAAKAVEEAAAAAKAEQEAAAGKKAAAAAKKAAAKKAAEEAAALAAAAAAAAAAAEADDDDDAWGAAEAAAPAPAPAPTPAPAAAKPARTKKETAAAAAPAAAPASPAVVEEDGSVAGGGLSALLDEWDDAE
jgi:hypothetical protein